MGMGTGLGMVDRKWEGNGNSSLVALVGWLAEQFAIFFIAIMRDLTV